MSPSKAKENKILGIDEAGRGALLGPLVICGALIHESKLKKLKALKVKNSKDHTPKQRVELAAELKTLLDGFEIIRILPAEIDKSRETGTNLNELEVQKMALIINSFKPHKVYIDAVDSKVSTFKKRLKNYIHIDTEIITEHEADSKYLIVSSASVLAKVERDSDIEELKKLYGEIGSGYPADPVTTNFLNNWLKTYKKLPKIVRKSWSTVSDVIGKEKQKSLTDFVNTQK